MEPGGEEYDQKKFIRGALRADLCEIAIKHSYIHGAKIVDAILDRYDVVRKK